MPFPAERRIPTALAALALLVIGSATIGLPAYAATPAGDPSVVVGPADGDVVGGNAVSFSVAPDALGDGYELRWGTDPAVDAPTGRLVNVDGGDDVIVTMPEYALVELDEVTYYWQVRPLTGGAGAWSEVRDFTVDLDGAGLQLETYPLTAPESPALPPPVSGVGGGVWIALASGFSLVLLVAVFAAWYRARRTA